ncbi:lamin tail domain-containing protein [Candidatus Saccharibacteria bacterium]|nr:lamin tail domain-containing protein [Candidatus Saccharibacteria bacterium]
MKKYILVVVGIIMSVVGIEMVGFDAVGAMGDEVGKAEEVTTVLPELYLKAINPGYTVDGKSNAGEMIEIACLNGSGDRISLAGITIRYTNSSGNDSILMEFPENSYLTGESIMLRLASAPESELANLNYSKTLAMKGGLALMQGEEVIDEVCWTGKEGCYREFVSAKPTSLVRDVVTGVFVHTEEYKPVYNAAWYEVETVREEEGYGVLAISQCKGIQFSEILSYYETNKSEQFIELYNPKSEQILLDGCQVRYKNKNYILTGVVGPEEYYVYYPKEFNLTKNPVNSNILELIDTDGNVIDKLTYLNGQRKGAAYAWIGYDEKGEKLWRVTYASTPGAPNNYQEFRTCEEGKVINEVTGNCVKVAAVTTKICPEGQYLNILTGRCKKYTTTTEKTCKEGYYLNPDTGRCRKIVENNGTDYSVEPEKYEEKTSFVALYAVLGVVGAGLVYLVYEFRREIVKLWRKVCRLFH